MPVVIKELHVKVNVEEDKRGRPGSSVSRKEKMDQDALVDACVQKVMEIMNQQKSR